LTRRKGSPSHLSPSPEGGSAQRRLPWAGLIVLLVAVAFAPALINVIVLKTSNTGYFPDQASVNHLILGQAVALAIAAVAVTALRWWPVVLREELRTRPWVWVAPISLLVVTVAATDYTRLLVAEPAIALSLLLGTMTIAATEELMFRGVVLRFMRDHYRETTAAIVTSALFALAHIAGGPLQIAATLAAGWVYYYVRRVSGGLLLPILVHGMLDFSIFSATTTSEPSTSSNAAPLTFFLVLILAIALIALHRFVDPKSPPSQG
jgi:membrane protease YdiL (CAAX protease family)